MREQIAHPGPLGAGEITVPMIIATAPATVRLPAELLLVLDELNTEPLQAPPYVVEGEVVDARDNYQTAEVDTNVPRPRRRISMPLAGALAAVSLALGVALALVLAPLLTATATVTLTPAESTLTTQATITATPARTSEVRARVLPAERESMSRTVATTGTATQPASPASGTVTFYNALPEPQTIAAGTLLLSASGVPVLTAEPASLPAATPPTDGVTTVGARAENTGPAGNIAADDIRGPCCRAYVLAYSSVFQGGADARTYPTPTRADIASAAAPLTLQVDSLMRSALGAWLQPGEALLSPRCATMTSSSAQPGAEAAHVTVTAAETCSAVAYDQGQLQQAATARLAALAAIQLGATYHLSGEVQAAITGTSVVRDSAILQVRLSGRYVYSLSGQQLTRLRVQLAGMSRAQAAVVLNSLAGVAQARIQSNATLPSDPSRIHILLSTT